MSQDKDPNWVATFSVTRNKDKFDANGNVITGKEKIPDFVSVDSEKINQNSGRPYRKNFAINGVWMEPSGYVQKDGSVKITIKKSVSKKKSKTEDVTAFGFGANI